MIIAGFAGIGKSRLAALKPDKYEDCVARPYKYFLDEDDRSAESDEASKGDCLSEIHWCWPCNYVNSLLHRNANSKNLLIPSDRRVLEDLRTEGVPYALVYPASEAKEEYRQRFISRGNSESFLEIFIDSWDSFMSELNDDPCPYRIILGPGQYLSDVAGQLEQWSSMIAPSSNRNGIRLDYYKNERGIRRMEGFRMGMKPVHIAGLDLFIPINRDWSENPDSSPQQGEQHDQERIH